MNLRTCNIVSAANQLVRDCGGARNPYQIADELDITVLPWDFHRQRGAYKVVMRNPFIFVKSDLSETMAQIVIFHEIGHHCLHRDIAEQCGGFKEFNIFDMQNNRMEYEANIFASQLALPDDEVLEYIDMGYDIQQVAAAMKSDINLVALKIDTLISQGYRLRQQEHSSAFLRYDK